MSPFSKMGFRQYLQFLSTFSRLVLILSGFTGSSFPNELILVWAWLVLKSYRFSTRVASLGFISAPSFLQMFVVQWGSEFTWRTVGRHGFCAVGTASTWGANTFVPCADTVLCPENAELCPSAASLAQSESICEYMRKRISRNIL